MFQPHYLNQPYYKNKPMDIDTTQQNKPMDHKKIAECVETLECDWPETVKILLNELHYKAPTPVVKLSDLVAGDKFKMADNGDTSDSGYTFLQCNGVARTKYVYLWAERSVIGGTDYDMPVTRL